MRRIRIFVQSAFRAYKNQGETSERLFKEPRTFRDYGRFKNHFHTFQ